MILIFKDESLEMNIEINSSCFDLIYIGKGKKYIDLVI